VVDRFPCSENISRHDNGAIGSVRTPTMSVNLAREVALLPEIGDSDDDDNTSVSSPSSSPQRKQKDLNMSTTFTGELGLLQSLNKLQSQRKSRQEKFAKENPGLTKVGKADKATLKAFRVVPGAEARRNEDAEVEAVLALPHSFPTVHPRRTSKKLASDEPSARIKQLKQTRQERHDEAVEKFQAARSDVAKSVEQTVTNLASNLKSELQRKTDDIAKIFAELGEGDKLAAHSMDEVQQAWIDIQTKCSEHRDAVEGFGRRISTVEKDRAKSTMELSRALAFDLVRIGHQLPDEIERYLEHQAEPINLVVLRNARAYAKMMARLRKKDVALFLSSRARHRQAVRDWRRLRHNEVIRRFNDRVDSEEFVDPENRKALFADARAARKNRHTKSRLKVLQRLRSLVPPMLDSKVVASVQQKIAEINTEEEAWYREFTKRFEATNTANATKTRELLEAARQELHAYCALAEEGDLKLRQKTLGTLIGDPELEEFLRKSGNLKKELEYIEDTLGKSVLIYQEPLAELKERVDFIRAGFDLNDLLAAQGKLADKKDIQGTLENMRVAKAADLVSMIPVLKLQLESLTSLGDLLHLTLLDTFEQSITDLEVVATEVSKIKATVGATESVKAGGSVRTRRTAKSSRSGRTARSGRSKASGGGGGEGISVTPEMVAKIRHVQRTVGLLLAADDLPKPIKEQLHGIHDDLELQRIANDAVDEDVAARCTEVIERRAVEAKVLYDVIVDALARQIEALDSACSRVATFYLGVAKDLEVHEHTRKEIDAKMSEDLADLKLDFEDAAEERETAIAIATKALRRAPSLEALAQLFKSVLGQLQDIENSYRGYFRDATGLAKQHPGQAQAESTTAVVLFSKHFNLVPADEYAQAVERKKIAVEEERRAAEEAAAAAAEAAAAAAAEAEKAAGSKKKDSKRKKSVQEPEPEEEPTPAQEEEQVQVQVPVQDDDDLDPVTGLPKYKPPEERVALIREHWKNVVPLDSAEESKEGSEPETVPIEHIDFRVLRSLGDFAAELVLVVDEEEEAEKARQERADAEAAEQASRNTDAGEENVESVTNVDGEGQQTVSVDDEDGSAPATVEDSNAVMQQEQSYQPTFKSQDYIETLDIPATLLEGMLRKLQEKLFHKLLRDHRNWQKAVSDVLRNRVEDLTDELEERLRQHWPRKGRTEVDQKQPRVRELNAHNEKLQRHVRSVARRDKQHGERHAAVLKECRDHIDAYSAKMQGLQAKLPLAVNLAALQGLLTKAKKETDTFQRECLALNSKLRPFVLNEPAKLAQSNANFLKVCATFPEGDDTDSGVASGDYNPEELQEIKEVLEAATQKVQDSVEGRNTRFQELNDARKEACSALDVFTANFQDCLKALSMSKGIGQKYGAPRRNAQERLRSLVTLSDREAEEREADLHELVELLQQTPGTLPENLSRPILAPVARRRGERASSAARVPPLSECVRRCIFRLQVKLHRRAEFLQQLRRNARKGVGEPETQLPMELEEADFNDEAPVTLDESNDGTESDPNKGEVESDIPPVDRSVFLSSVMQACTDCENETKELYRKEGMEETVPESLKSWLVEQRRWAKEQRLRAAADLKRQVQWFRSLLPKLSELVMVDVAARTRARMTRRSGKLAKSLDRRLKLWEAAKAQHTVALKPRLASPNQAEELRLLVEKEATRSQEVLDAVGKTEVKVVAELRDATQEFKRRIVHNATALVQLLDRCLDAEDFKPLRFEDEDILLTERGHGLERGSSEYEEVANEVKALTAKNGAVTLRERPLDELQLGLSGRLLRAAPGLETKNSSFASGDQVEVKVQLSSRHGAPAYSPGDVVKVHTPHLVSSIPQRYAGTKSDATSFRVVEYRNADGTVLVDVSGAGARETARSPASANTVVRNGPYEVPEQLICGENDLFIPGVVVNRKESGVRNALNAGLNFKYDVEFEKAHASLRRLRRKERRVGRDGEPDPAAASNGDGPRVRRERVWAGIDLAQLTLPDDAAALLAEIDEAKAAEAAAQAADAKKSKGKKPSKGKSSKDPASSDENATTTSPELKSLLLPPQRATIRSRDGQFSEFVTTFADILQSLRGQYADLVAGEQAWMDNWANMVKILKSSGSAGDDAETKNSAS